MRPHPKTMLLVLAIALAAAGCGEKEQVSEYKATWIRLSHTPIQEAAADTPTRLQAEIEVSEDIEQVELFIHCESESSFWGPVEMTRLEPGLYFGSIPAMKRGTLVEYSIQARAGDFLEVRVPGEDEDRAFTFYSKGTPNRPVLIAHLALMLLALFLFIMCGYLAVRAIRDRKTRLQIPRLGFLGGVVFFIASVPLGMIVEYQTYGRPWSGFPVGTDITDNKSLVILLYFAAATFLYRGSVFRRDPSRDLIKQVSTLPYVYLVGAIITIALYLLPH